MQPPLENRADISAIEYLLFYAFLCVLCFCVCLLFISKEFPVSIDSDSDFDSLHVI